MTYHTIRGRVKDEQGNAITDISGLKVVLRTPENWTPNYQYTDSVNSSGDYYFAFYSSTVSWLFHDQHGNWRDQIEMLFEAKDGQGTVIASLQRVVTWNQICDGVVQDLVVESEEDKVDPGDCVHVDCVPCEYRMSGSVLEADGTPIVGANITVYHQKFRERESLASAQTDAFGRYSTLYLEDEPCNLSGPGIELIVEATDADGSLAISPLICNPSNLEVVDLLRSGQEDARTEFESLRWSVAPHLDGETLESMEPSDVEFLACRTGQPEKLLETFVRSIRLGQERPLAGESSSSSEGLRITYYAYYSWLRGGLGNSVAELRALEREALSAGLFGAAAEGQVPTWAEGMVEALINEFKGGASGDDWLIPDTEIHDVLVATGLPLAILSDFVKQYDAHVGKIQDFWLDYANATSQAQAARIQYTLQIAGLTERHQPLMKLLLDRYDSPEISNARDLAQYDQSQWRSFLDLSVDLGSPPTPTQIGAPSYYPGEDENERREHYATALDRAVASAFPTEVLAHRLSTIGGAFTEIHGVPVAEIQSFLLSRASDTERRIDFRFTIIDDYFDRFESPSHPPMRSALKTLQRIWASAPAENRTAAVAELYSARDFGDVFASSRSLIRSARDVVDLGQAEFVDRFRNTFGEEGAVDAYRQAEQRNALTLGLATLGAAPLNLKINAINPRPIGPGDSPGPVNLEDLFGSLDACSCRHCRSVLSPSAYLVDLLEFVGLHGRRALTGALGEFGFPRRADILKIGLDCRNANTPLPAIDLANEILERHVEWIQFGQLGSGNNPAFLVSYQTTWSADALLAHPEYLLIFAYEILRTIDIIGNEFVSTPAVQPWILPFDLFLEEARAYLGHLGISRAKLLDVLVRDSPQVGRQDAIAAEWLGLPRSAYGLVHSTELPAEGSRNAASAAWSNARDHNASASWNGLGSLGALDDVETFLERSDLSFEDALTVMDSWFAGRLGQAAPQVTVRYEKECTLAGARFHTGAEISQLGPDRLSRIHRFVRLRHALAWDFDQVDRAIRIFADGPEVLTSTTLRELGDLQRLRQRWKRLDIEEMLTWWGRIDTARRSRVIDSERIELPSQFDRLFLRPELRKPAHSSSPGTLFDDERLIPDGNGAEAEIPAGHVVADAIDAIAAALETSDREIRSIDRHLGGTNPNDPSGPPTLALSVESLSRIYRRVSVARALGVSIAVLIRFEAISGLDLDASVAGQRVADLTAFVEALDQLEDLDTKPRQLAYLLSGAEANFPFESFPDNEGEDDNQVLGDLEAARMVLSIVLGLQELSGSTEEVPDFVEMSAEERVRHLEQQLLEIVDDAELVRDALAAIQGSVNDETVDQRVALATRALLDEFVDPSVALPYLTFFGIEAVTDGEQRVQAVISGLIPLLQRRAKRSFVTQQLASALNMPAAVVEYLLARIVDHAGYDVLIDDQLRDIVVLSEQANDLREEDKLAALALQAVPAVTVLRGLKRIADLIAQVGLSYEQIVWLGSAVDPNAGTGETGSGGALPSWGERMGIPALESLIGGTAALPTIEAISYEGWTQLQRLQRVVDEVFRNTWPSFVRVQSEAARTGATVQTVLGVLAEVIEENLDDLVQLETPLGLSIESDHGFASDSLLKVAEALGIRDRSGVPMEKLVEWTQLASGSSHDVSVDQALSIKRYVRSKYDERAYAKAIRPLRDALRERQRDALLAYVRAHNHWPDRDVYSWLLLDTEVNACAMTSRIKAALGSVQLLVQRAMLNVEPAYSLSADKAEMWPTMGRYRIWEANRKVFLYPENWVDPQFRRDKTPLFLELESALSQDELDEATIERAYLGYLTGLDEIARLDVAGVYHESERSSRNQLVRNVVHVFGRTRGQSGAMYYRRWEDGGGWTPWEKLPFEVDAPDVLPVVYNRRLYLIWPKFEEKAEEPTEEERASRAEPKRYLDLRLGWAELQYGEWTPPRQSEATLKGEAIVVKSASSSGQVSSISRRDHKSLSKQGFHLDSRFENGKLLVHVLLTADADLGGEDGEYYCGWFEFGGCDGGVRAVRAGERVEFSIPSNTTIERQGYRGTKKQTFSLPVSEQQLKHLILNAENYEVMASWQSPISAAQHAFYQDERRTFFIEIDRETSGNNTSFSWMDSSDSNLVEPGYATTHYSGGFLSRELQRSAGPGFAQTQILGTKSSAKIRMKLFYHPFTCEMISQVNRYGVEGLLAPGKNGASGGEELRRQRVKRTLFQGPIIPMFQASPGGVPYQPGTGLRRPYPVEKFEFAHGSAFGAYNWELFFHAPMLIADRLLANRRFAEARRWLHYIFDPTSGYSDSQDGSSAGADRFWKIRPFTRQEIPSVGELVGLLNGLPSEEDSEIDEERREELLQQVEYIQENPFDPHGLARLRPTAYMHAVVMKYIDVLIAWGDHLFRQDTIESINEATLLYALASSLLGKRPEQLPEQVGATYDYLAAAGSESDIEFSNFLVDLESVSNVHYLQTRGRHRRVNTPRFRYGAFAVGTGLEVPNFPLGTSSTGSESNPPEIRIAEEAPTGFGSPSLYRKPQMQPLRLYVERYFLGQSQEIPAQRLYFCIPRNERLLGYWDTVDDRLFKIRNCLNIEGVRRQLRLFEPPIDPGELVKAVAAGVDLGSAVADLNAPSPYYRFSVYIGVAKEFVGELRSFGANLLSALEKKDSEELAKIRAEHDFGLLERVRDVLLKRIEESEEAIESLQRSREVVEDRFRFYQDRKSRISHEKDQIRHLRQAMNFSTGAAVMSTAAAVPSLIPNLNLGATGFTGTPTVTLVFGGLNVAQSLQAVAGALSSWSGQQSALGQLRGVSAGLKRRDEEWEHQVAQAEKEMLRIDQEIAVTQLRLNIAERELKRHDRQAEQSKEVFNFLSDKFTSVELYDWMHKELSKLYFQAYEIAYDLAKRAQRSYQRELGLELGSGSGPGSGSGQKGASFIQFGHWDSQRKGLLAGERLGQDLRRLEAAYYDQNRREYELTKRISLAQIDPVALMELQQSGTCSLEVPEVLYDLDHPSHYMRRIKSVALSIPAVTGPYSNVNCQLSLQSSKVRTRPSVDGEALVDDLAGELQTIATSNGLEDSGMFEPNLNDARYLPFEGKGAVSSWLLKMPANYRSFDYGTISDAVLTIRYTAREGGEGFGNTVSEGIADRLQDPSGGDPGQNLEQWLPVRAMSLRQSFSSAWQTLVGTEVAGESERSVNFAVPRHQISTAKILDQGEVIVAFVFKSEQGLSTAAASSVSFNGNDLGDAWIRLPTPSSPPSDPSLVGAVQLASAPVNNVDFGSANQAATWSIQATFDPSQLEDIVLLVHFQPDV